MTQKAITEISPRRTEGDAPDDEMDLRESEKPGDGGAIVKRVVVRD